MSDMPEPGHCACKFSSGGVLSKTCDFHSRLHTKLEALERENSALSHDIARHVQIANQYLNDHLRYEYLRRLSPQTFGVLWNASMKSNTPFDSMVDAARKIVA